MKKLIAITMAALIAFGMVSWTSVDATANGETFGESHESMLASLPKYPPPPPAMGEPEDQLA